MPRPESRLQRNAHVERHHRSGFTLVEALVAISLIAMCGAALLLATELALDSSTRSVDEKIARGLANQLIDEILGLPYVEKGEPASQQWWQLGPETGEWSWPVVRNSYDDADDYRVLSMYPPTDEFAVELGLGDEQGGLRHPNFRVRDNYFDDWLVFLIIWHADESDLSANIYSGSSVSGFRAIEVTIRKYNDDGTWQELTKLRRVFGYVPPVS